MSCSQCLGIENLFDQKSAEKDLSRYLKKGPDKTTRILVEAIQKEGIQGFTLLDIGGGVGAIQYALLDSWRLSCDFSRCFQGFFIRSPRQKQSGAI